MKKNGFTLIEAILATSLATVAMVALLLVRQNCLKQMTRAAELEAVASVAQKIINTWRVSDFLQSDQIPLNGTIAKMGLSWCSEIEDVEVLPEHWMPSLTVRFFTDSHNDKDPIASFAGLKYSQNLIEEIPYE